MKPLCFQGKVFAKYFDQSHSFLKSDWFGTSSKPIKFWEAVSLCEIYLFEKFQWKLGLTNLFKLQIVQLDIFS